ncbi:MAG: RNase adapter RapZ [Candidatus Eremiobacteraeota bacterium]|nr:RNase adapter RapZ [Candidatus Eremiobacteraeota bacterium]
MKSFEDLGFYCSDNLPPALAWDLVLLAERSGITRVALSLETRVGGPFGEAPASLADLEARGVAFEILYLDASDEALVRRYSETRRRHPHECSGRLPDSIALERRSLEPLRERATSVWDTSDLTLAALKARVVAEFGDATRATAFPVHVVAFGFKNGIPLDADLVFDVRFFPNPNYVVELKPLTGADGPVADFMVALPETAPFLGHLFGTIDFVLPLYIAEGKSRLTIAIGCTGGRHRSVYIADRLADHLATRAGVAVLLDRRELSTAS